MMQLSNYFLLIIALSCSSLYCMEERIEQSIRTYLNGKNYTAARSLAKQLSATKSQIWLDKIDAAEKFQIY